MLSKIETSDGSASLVSKEYGVSYHSKFGAVTESAHVFIGAGLRDKALDQEEIHILETGFGTGLNAFLSAIEAEILQRTVHYTGLEIHPISQELAADMGYAQALQIPEKEGLYLAMHQAALEKPVELSPRYTFTKKHTPIEQFEAKEAFDVIYFDAFAPLAQPELWTEEVFQRMYQALKPDGILVTYCAQGAFKRILKSVGFAVERLKGPPGKREMTRARKLI
ncbi:MAG: tRNA (5-methylaminomethyl-2-thiouridine)(34)-methyltransferase MnmD [Saprospiraceae bacterium]